jgi:hypothetical protein
LECSASSPGLAKSVIEISTFEQICSMTRLEMCCASPLFLPHKGSIVRPRPNWGEIFVLYLPHKLSSSYLSLHSEKQPLHPHQQITCRHRPCKQNCRQKIHSCGRELESRRPHQPAGVQQSAARDRARDCILAERRRAEEHIHQ